MSRKSAILKNQKIVLPIGHNFTPGCSGFVSTETAASWGVERRFWFVANSGNANEAGIDKKICVGYKGEFAI